MHIYLHAYVYIHMLTYTHAQIISGPKAGTPVDGPLNLEDLPKADIVMINCSFDAVSRPMCVGIDRICKIETRDRFVQQPGACIYVCMYVCRLRVGPSQTHAHNHACMHTHIHTNINTHTYTTGLFSARVRAGPAQTHTDSQGCGKSEFKRGGSVVYT